MMRQAGAELGQAQPQLGLGYRQAKKGSSEVNYG